MTRFLQPLTTILILLIAVTTVSGSNLKDIDEHAAIISSDASEIDLEFTLTKLESYQVILENQDYNAVLIPGEGTTFEYGKPVLPMVCRFVVVPSDAGLELEYQVNNQRRVRADLPPALFLDNEVVQNQNPLPVDLIPKLRDGGNETELQDIYPANIVEMSEPFIIRGARLVKITTYPVQYDPVNQEYIYNEQIKTSIRYTDEEPINPVRVPVRRNRSPQFLKFIRALAINGDIVGRDDPDRDADPEYIGHYLIATHANCLQYAGPFIEWRRKSGYKVDILSFSNNEARNSNTVQRDIQERYDEYLDDGIDPFDELLLIGDRAHYYYSQAANWVLMPHRGSPTWGNDFHGDYLFACLEGGNDHHPDVGYSRWHSGSQNLMELAVGRTLAYEAEPHMDDTDWFTRGGNYSQHWGNNAVVAWHITIHTNARWGEEVLQQLGFDEVHFYERYEYDQQGQVIGPEIRDWLNEGLNVMVGRAENYYWRQNFNGVNNNVVFPINICHSGHGEWCAESMTRNGSGNNLKGPVAMTYGWGNPRYTAPISASWMECVNGFLLRDLPLGWARAYAITAIEAYFGGGQNYVLSNKTEFDCFGDPGIQAWIGVPRIVEADYPEIITSETRLIEVTVTDTDDDNVVEGARVTFYVPGDMPDFNEAAYAGYDDTFMLTKLSDEDGIVRFILSDDIELEGDEAFVTVTGRDIRPFFGEIDIRRNISAIDLSAYILTEAEGNEDDEINPGETFSLELTAHNLGNRDEMQDVTAVVTSASPWVEIEENEITFGDIGAGDDAEGDEAVTLHIHPACPDGTSRPKTRPVLIVEFQSGDDSYRSAIELNPSAPHFKVRRIIGGDQIEPGQSNLDIELINIGSMNAPEVSATLETHGMGVSVVIEEALYPAINSNRYARIAGDRFLISGNRIAIPGSRHPLEMILETENGFIDTVYFELQVDEPRENAPQGPDGYGYIAFDDTDDDWDISPDYDWIEICPRDNDADYEGEYCDFDGRSDQDVGESEVVQMGMTTQFYGEVFDRITISTNGFIAMGDQGRITNFQNWPMDRAIGGGAGMLAPFWDWLDYNNNSRVCYYHDEDEGRFIIEWYRMRHHSGGNSDLTFQVILYDNEIWITEMGDQNILFQYKNISQARGQQDGASYEKNIPFASVGISSLDGTTGINYSFKNEYPVTSARLQNRRAILFATSPRFRSGMLHGRVTDAETEEGIEGAVIFTGHGFTAITDEEGFWRINDALAEVPFPITAMAQGYNDSSLVELIVEEDDSLEINFALLHPEFIPSHEALGAELEVNEAVELEFEIENSGNGPLYWRAEEQLRGDANADPWELRRQYMVGDSTDDSRIQGVIYIEDRFYVTGSNDRDARIYIFDREGNQIDQFEQFGGGGIHGIRDMAWDGEWIWGSGEETIYAFTPEGELMREFEGPYRYNHFFAWDTDREILWVTATTSNIIGLDREGNVVAELSRKGLRQYGLAYWPDDPDGYPLYIIHKITDFHDQIVHKMNPENGDTAFVRILEPEDPATATYITNQFDVYSWVYMVLTNDGPHDRIDVWQLDARRDWFDLEPITGTINPGNTQEFTLELNATDLPIVRFEADLVFYHNADDGEFILPIALDVLGGRRNLNLELNEGWNLVSINVEPNDLDVTEIVRPLTDAGILSILKNGDGQFYLPELGFINIDHWEVSEGYQINVSEPAQLRITGAVIPADRPIDLDEGWNMTAYFPRQPVDAITALSGIAEHLALAKDGIGRFYLPEFEFSNMGELREGQGYQYKLNEAVQLVYQLGDNVAATTPTIQAEPEYFNPGAVSEVNMSILILGDPSYNGWEVGVLTQSGILIGAGKFDATGRCGLAAWSDNTVTKYIDGACNGEPLSFKLWNGENEFEVELDPLIGKQIWKADETYVGRILNCGSTPVEFGIHDSYPNPANGPVRLVFGLEEDEFTVLSVFNLTGRKVTDLVNGKVRAGYHNVIWNTDLIPSGIYLIRLEAAGQVNMAKVAVLK